MAKDLDDMDDLLLDWGDWFLSHGLAEGSGGGMVFDTADRMDMGPRQVGTHSDPVVAEVLRELMTDKTTYARVHRNLLTYPLKHRRLVKLRYIGLPGRALMEARGYDGVMEATMRNTYSGLLPWSQVQEHSGLTESQARDVIRQVKKWLRRDQTDDRRVRAGFAGIDGNVRAA